MKHKCQWCGSEEDTVYSYWTMTPIVPELEEQINKLGRDTWFEKLETETTDELEKLAFYDQLLNTFGNGYVCKKCYTEDELNYIKYYE